MEGEIFDTIKYKLYADMGAYLVIYDKLDKTFCIHSSIVKNDVGMVTGFEKAAEAIDFAENRILDIDIPSTITGAKK